MRTFLLALHDESVCEMGGGACAKLTPSHFKNRSRLGVHGEMRNAVMLCSHC